jgi:DNA-binding SARP family transcriptional activator
MAHRKLLVLGQPRLEIDDQPVEINLRKALALLVYLAVSGQPHSRDALGALLWPESDAREGRARLRRTVHRLGLAIGESLLDSGSETLRLAAHADLWLDSVAFRQHATAGLAESPHGASAPKRLAHLSAAVELYAEDFLSGFTLPDSLAFDEWQFFQRESLRQLYGQVLEQLVQACRAQQQWDEAIAHARRWLALDGLHEPAHRLLMRLYAEAGRHAAALRQYQECTRLLEAELGVEPEDETTALHEVIRVRQIGRATPLAPASEPVPTPPLPPPHDSARNPSANGPLFVAREPELRWLDSRLAAALTGQHGIAFVTGEAGQGKTALLRSFAAAAQAAHPELLVAWGSCNAYIGIGDPYLPFREILELLTGDLEHEALPHQLHDHATRLWRMAPAATQTVIDTGPDLLDTFVPIRGLLRRADDSADSGAAWIRQLHSLAASKAARPADPRQQDLFEQYARVLQALARQAPLLLIVDDLQWADRGSADLLLHLGRRLRGHRALLVGAYRPADVAIGRDGERHPLERVVGELQRDAGQLRLDLGQAEGRALIDALLDSEPNRLDEAFRAALYQQTGGHPLFTIELLREMQERGALTSDETCGWIASPTLHWTRLPARVEGVIGERIGRLEAPLRELLQLASVEGEEFTAEVVARALGRDEHEVVRRLSRELDQTHHLVQALGVRRDEGMRLSRYRFQHNLIQRYLYGSLDEIEQVYGHEAIGHALEERYGARAVEIAAQLARHFAAAQLPEKAASYYEQAGDQARRAAALAEAADYYQAALEVWPQSDQSGRAMLWRKLGECHWVRGHLQDALPPFEASDALYEALGNREGAGGVQRLLGRLYWEQGDRERSLRHYHNALALLEQGPDNVELAWAISSISQMHMLASDYGPAISWGQCALDMAERLEATDVIVPTLANIGNSYIAIGNAALGQAMLRDSWQRAVEQHLPYDACRAAYLLASRLIDLGLTLEAREKFEELHTYAARQQMPLGAGGSLISLARLDWLAGRWKEVLARRQDIVAWVEQGQSISYLEVIASTTFAWMHNDIGQPEIAHQFLEQAQPKVIGRAEIQTTGPHLGQQIRTLGMLGRASEATQVARQFQELIEQQQDYWDSTMPYLAACHWFAGCAPEMQKELAASLAQLERADTQLGSPATAASLSEARGLAALGEGGALRAIEYLQQAAMQWQALGRPYDEARVLVALGRALSQAGTADELHAALDRALNLVEALAAQLEDVEMHAAFLGSPLVQELQRARAECLPDRELVLQ